MAESGGVGLLPLGEEFVCTRERRTVARKSIGRMTKKAIFRFFIAGKFVGKSFLRTFAPLKISVTGRNYSMMAHSSIG